MKVETVDSVAYCVHRFLPKTVGSLVLIKHGSCHLYESAILSFRNPILLRRVRCGKLMVDPFTIQELFNLSVLELASIVAPYPLDFLKSNSF